MAESSAAADAVALPSTDAIDRAVEFTREPFVYEGEDPAVALAPGSARRRALDAALAELEAGATVPSTEWRRGFSLLLGLERLLSQEEPHLVDGTLLNPHQVDALSGTLTALLAAAQGNGNGNGAAVVEDVPLASAAIPGEEEPEDDEELDDEPVAEEDEDFEEEDEEEPEAEEEPEEEMEAEEEPEEEKKPKKRAPARRRRAAPKSKAKKSTAKAKSSSRR